MFDRDLISGDLTYKAAISGPSVNGPQLIAISPDGEQVYVTNGIAGTLVVFDRNPTSGLLSIGQVLAASSYPDLLGAYGVTVSSNGRFIYVTSVIQNAIIGFERLTDDTLVYRGANSDSSNVDLIGARNLTTSPDGRNLYVTADPAGNSTNGNILVYNIDPLTGAIDHEQTFHEGDFIGNPPFFIILDGLGGAYDVVVSPDGEDVYVVATYDGTVMNFIRDPTTGRLTYNAGLEDGDPGVDGLDGVSGIDMTPDGKHVATTSFNDDAVAVYERNPSNGRLAQIQVITPGLLFPFNPQLRGARDVEISPDGTSVHAAAFTDDAVVSLHTINPIPVLDTLSPASASAGSSGLLVTVQGQHYLPGIEVSVNGAGHTTTYVNGTTLETTLTASDLATAGTLMIGAENPLPNAGAANPELAFTVTPVSDNPVPTISALLPGGIAAGGGVDVTITVEGINFISISKVHWNSLERSTVYLNGSTLQVTIPGAELSAVGTAVVTVVNPTPGGGTSNPASFTILQPWLNPVPTILTLVPEETTQFGVTGEAAQVGIQGIGFIEDSQAQWNGENRPTQYISDTELEITLTAVDMTPGGIGSITVVNPPSGGGTSNAVPFTITRYKFGTFLPVTIH
jgi:6-phosphogluconolactonase (cycloisomerase 2 family)